MAKRRQKSSLPDSPGPATHPPAPPWNREPIHVLAAVVTSPELSDLGRELLEALLPGNGLSVILVQRPGPPTALLVADKLRKRCHLRLVEAEDRQPLGPDTIYLVPPNWRARCEQGTLRLSPATTPQEDCNDLLASMGSETHVQLAAVLFSEEDLDLPALEQLQAEGGLTFTNLDRDANQAADSVDYLLPPREIAAELSRLCLRTASQDFQGRGWQGNNAEYLPRILALLRHQTGVDFSLYKQATVNRRIWRRLLLHHAENLEHYHQILRQSGEALESLHQDLLISVTGLFRDPKVFSTFSQDILPALLTATQPGQPLRVWVPGCSKGDEAYSLAISILEALPEQSNLQVQIFATDVNERALERARAGIYPESLAQELSSDRLQRFFHRVEKGYQISKRVRDLCLFARQDLTRDPPFSRLDLITCRNVLIYLNANLQYKILRIFHYALKPGGILILGASESIGRASEFFVEVDRAARIFARKQAATPPAPELFELAPLSQVAPGPAAVRGHNQLGEVQKEADRLVLARFAPPGVIVNKELEILQYRGRTGMFFENPSGTVTLNLLKLAREGLLSELRSALQQVQQTGQTTKRSGLRVRTNGDWHSLDLEVHPISPPASRERYFLVLFQPHEATPELPVRGPTESRSESETVRLLQEELEATRDYLNASTQEQEVTLEILQAAHEELQSANEELQSTNEELETAKEELQSTNEELTTVNEELHERNLQLTKLNNDLNNLLSSVSLPVIILGADLRIRRFTPVARQVLKVIPGDIGRPIGDLRPQVEIPDLEARIQDVLDNLCPQQFEVQDRDGRWYSVRIRPYRTSENRIDGVVLVFVDVDQLRRSLDEALAAQEIARGLLEAIEKPAVVLDADLRIRQVNRLFLRVFGLQEEEVGQRSLLEMPGELWQGTDWQASLKEALAHGEGGRFGWSHDHRRIQGTVYPGLREDRHILTLAVEELETGAA